MRSTLYLIKEIGRYYAQTELRVLQLYSMKLKKYSKIALKITELYVIKTQSDKELNKKFLLY